jgi:hypothetical protein
MKKARLIAGMTAAIPAAAGGFAAPAAAHATQATTAPAHQVPVKGKTVQHHGMQADTTGPAFYSLSVSETLYLRTGGQTLLTAFDLVYVTCYYSGAPHKSDPYWDHVTDEIVAFTNHHLHLTGHLWDGHVDMNGKTPPNNGIPHC